MNMGKLMQQRGSVHVCDPGTRIRAGGRLSHSERHHYFDPRGRRKSPGKQPNKLDSSITNEDWA